MRFRDLKSRPAFPLAKTHIGRNPSAAVSFKQSDDLLSRVCSLPATSAAAGDCTASSSLYSAFLLYFRRSFSRFLHLRRSFPARLLPPSLFSGDQPFTSDVGSLSFLAHYSCREPSTDGCLDSAPSGDFSALFSGKLSIPPFYFIT